MSAVVLVQLHRGDRYGSPAYLDGDIRCVHYVLVPARGWPPARGNHEAVIGAIVFDDLEDRLPLFRAVSLTPKQRLIREMVLQLKTGRLDTVYFQKKFGVDVWQEFQPVYERLEEKSLLQRDNGMISLTRRGLLEVDHFLLDFF